MSNQSYQYTYAKRYRSYLGAIWIAILILAIIIALKASRNIDSDPIYLFIILAPIAIYHVINWKNKYEFVIGDEYIEYFKNMKSLSKIYWDKVKLIEVYDSKNWSYINIIGEEDKNILFDNYMGNLKEFRANISPKVDSSKFSSIKGVPRKQIRLILVVINLAIISYVIISGHKFTIYDLVLLLVMNIGLIHYYKAKKKNIGQIG